MSTQTAPRLVVQTNGMGVDSAAWLTAVLRGDIAIDFDLADLVVVTAMTGDESERTRWAMETFLLPLMRQHNIRYVQLARAGWSETDGVAVLSDSRTTERMVMRGKVSLSMEAERAGTIPQQSNRVCSYRFKGWVLDTWLSAELGETPRRHMVGFAAEETGRARRDDGYSRLVPGKVPWYPLIELGWDREQCLSYLFDVYGIEWPRSCCGFCPFQAGPDMPRMAERWRAEPSQARTAVRLEATAMALNPRMRLFGDRSAADLARSFGMSGTVDEALGDLDDMPARIYEVCRIYRRRGDRRGPGGAGWVLGPDPADKGTDVWRALRNLGEDRMWGAGMPRTRRAALDMLRRIQTLVGGELEMTDVGGRLWFQRAAAPYPCTEHYIAVTIAGIADKERTAFTDLWDFTSSVDVPRQTDLFSFA